MKKVSIFAATVPKRAIGKGGDLPFQLPLDQQYFRFVTGHTPTPGKINACLMGRLSYTGIPSKFRPFTDRLSVVITSKPIEEIEPTATPDQVRLVNSMEAGIKLIEEEFADKCETIFILGGEGIFKEAFEKNLVDEVCETRVALEVEDCDTFVVDVPQSHYSPLSVSGTYITGAKKVPVDFVHWVRKEVAEEMMQKKEAAKWTSSFRTFMEIKKKTVASKFVPPFPMIVEREHDEFQYLDCIAKVIQCGKAQDDRTGVGTVATFGERMVFDLSRGAFPLLTTKRVFWRGMVEELLWFMKGRTNALELAEKGIHIWDGNGSRAFLDSRGLTHYQEGELGPVYGFQWRFFGAEYEGCRASYEGKGVDQLMRCVECLKKDPYDRRMIVSAWNPADLDKMALPPCHMFCQFYVEEGELSCALYQRSGDLGLGIPFNIASYSLMTLIMARLTNLKPGKFIHFIGNAHVYKNHIEPLKVQLKRLPRPFPQVVLDDAMPTTIEDIESSHFVLKGYFPLPKIAMAMAV